MYNKIYEKVAYATVLIPESLIGEGYTDRQNMEMLNYDLKENSVVALYLKQSEKSFNWIAIVMKKDHVKLLTEEYYKEHEIDIESMCQYSGSEEFYKSYLGEINFIRGMFGDNYSNVEFSSSLSELIEEIAMNKIEEPEGEEHATYNCINCNCEIECSDFVDPLDKEVYCSIECYGEYNMPNDTSDTQEVQDDYHDEQGKLYSIPSWVTDIDSLSDAWNLSSNEFNAIKGIYGASRIRQGLSGRHTASIEEPERDFNKAITYTNKMLDAYIRDK